MDEGRVALVSYKFAGLLKQDPAFMRDCDTAQNMQIKGLLGMVDGTKIVRVPKKRLPAGCQFLLCHPIATVAPTVLSEYKIHTDAPGISGWLCEGRVSLDAFVLNNKKDALYYSGPFSASMQNLILKQGEVFTVDSVNKTGTVTAAVTGTGTKPTASVSGGAVTITTTSSTSTGDFEVTLTDTPASGTAVTTVVKVTVV